MLIIAAADAAFAALTLRYFFSFAAFAPSFLLRFADIFQTFAAVRRRCFDLLIGRRCRLSVILIQARSRRCRYARAAVEARR